MDFKPILTAALMIGGMGLIFGALLAIIGRIFRVEEDPKKAAVRECLPGANCGGCGFAGCDAYAEQVASGNAPVDKCPVGGDAVAQQIAGIMGVEAGKREKRIATVRCRGSLDRCKLRFDYDGPGTARARRWWPAATRPANTAASALAIARPPAPLGPSTWSRAVWRRWTRKNASAAACASPPARAACCN